MDPRADRQAHRALPRGSEPTDRRGRRPVVLSVISGRNPEALIGKHVEAATRVRELGIGRRGCGYMLIDGGRTTTAHYMSGSLPIPGDKPDIAATTALAGHYLGQQCMYLDTGSGADHPVSNEMIAAVHNSRPLSP